MVFVHTVFNSMQDVAVDALAVDLLDEAERGRANGLMYASKYGGGVLGGAGMTTLIGAFGLRSALAAQTAVLLAIMMLPLLVRERAGDSGSRVPRRSIAQWARDAVRGIAAMVAREPRAVRAAVIGGVLVVVVNISSGVLTAIAPVLFTQHLGWNDTDYVQLTGGPGLALGLVGSILGGFLADRVGHRRLAAIASIALAGFWLVWAAAAAWWTDRSLVYALFAIEPLCQSVMTVAIFALCMDLSWPRIAATQFGAYMALLNVSTTLGFRLAGHDDGTGWIIAGSTSGRPCSSSGSPRSLLFIDPRARRESERIP